MGFELHEMLSRHQFLAALEKGSYNPSLELAFRLAKFFKISIEKLFFEKGVRHE